MLSIFLKNAELSCFLFLSSSHVIFSIHMTMEWFLFYSRVDWAVELEEQIGRSRALLTFTDFPLIGRLIDWLDNWSATLDEMKKQKGTFSPQSESLTLIPVLNGAGTRKSSRKSKWTRTREREPRWEHTVRFDVPDCLTNQSINQSIIWRWWRCVEDLFFHTAGFSAYRIALI